MPKPKKRISPKRTARQNKIDKAAGGIPKRIKKKKKKRGY